MNALKALQKKKLPRDTKVTPSLFHPKRGNKEWSDKTFYVNRIETAYSKGDSQKQGGNLGKRYQIVYVSEKPYFQGDIAGFGIARVWRAWSCSWQGPCCSGCARIRPARRLPSPYISRSASWPGSPCSSSSSLSPCTPHPPSRPLCRTSSRLLSLCLLCTRSPPCPQARAPCTALLSSSAPPRGASTSLREGRI